MVAVRERGNLASHFSPGKEGVVEGYPSAGLADGGGMPGAETRRAETVEEQDHLAAAPGRCHQRLDQAAAHLIRFEDIHLQPHPLRGVLDSLEGHLEGVVAVGEERQAVVFRGPTYRRSAAT